MFEYFGRSQSQNSLQADSTITIADLLNMFKKAKILDTERITTAHFIDIVEHFYANGSSQKLKEKLSQESFCAYIAANPMALAVNREVDEINQFNTKLEEEKKANWFNQPPAAEGEEKPVVEPKEMLPAEEIAERQASEAQDLQGSWTE